MTQLEYKNKAVELGYSTRAFADYQIGIPEFIKAMAIQIFIYGSKDVEFEEVTRSTLTSLLTTAELGNIFDNAE